LLCGAAAPPRSVFNLWPTWPRWIRGIPATEIRDGHTRQCVLPSNFANTVAAFSLALAGGFTPTHGHLEGLPWCGRTHNDTVAALLIIRSSRLTHTLVYVRHEAVAALLKILRARGWHTRWCMSSTNCDGHAVAALIIVQSSRLAHTLVYVQHNLQRACRCCSDNNSELEVGTHKALPGLRTPRLLASHSPL